MGLTKNEAIAVMSPHPNDRAIDPAQILIALPLFDQFYALALAIAQQRSKQPLSTADKDWIEVLNGFIVRPVHQFQNGGYWCTPLNTLTFAETGTDGEQFSFLVQQNRITPDTPVVYTAPISEANNVIVAPNFKLFLRLGMQYGFFELGNLLSTPTQTIRNVDNMFDRQADSERLEAREHLSAIAHHLKLTPYQYSVDEFITLQLQYLPCLRMRQDYLEDYGN